MLIKMIGLISKACITRAWKWDTIKDFIDRL